MSDPAKIAVILNRGAKSVTDVVISQLSAVIPAEDLFVSHQIEEAPLIAEKIIRGGYSVVLTGGGDGTFTVMVTEIVRSATEGGINLPQFGLLKLGTGNALASVVEPLPLSSHGGALDLRDACARAGQKAIHLVDIEGTLSPFAGLGADAKILSDYNATKKLLSATPFAFLGKGLSGYAIAACFRSLPALMLHRMPKIRVFNEGADAWPIGPLEDEKSQMIPSGSLIYEGPARMAALSTIPYYGFGMRLFPFADTSPGYMHLRVCTLGSLRALTNIRGLWDGSYHDPRVLSDFMVESVRIECDEATEFQVGGDHQGCRNIVHAKTSERSFSLLNFALTEV